ncbi:putative transferase CAF17 homolog, mitochondrial [Uloborus diversus]|uniref:putative transferase CAF17 homolog, mitochondrial n=1 Tax=Uloborus diversus TaxID=327109 RepID=UPI0024094198|nr:putative transferase CAF17 homolog, mitochondrial [Uloborus diversus]
MYAWNAFNFKSLKPSSLTRLSFIRKFSSHKSYVEKLNRRAILKLSGPDTTNYLQSMITNDINKIAELPSLYSLLLNPKGRVLYDSILYKMSAEEYLVEYDCTGVEYMQKHLVMYRLRKNVKIHPNTDVIAWVIYPERNDETVLSDLSNIILELTKCDGVVAAVEDPRTKLLGFRILTKKDIDFPKLLSEKFNIIEGNKYTQLRYSLGIGEGVTDHPPGNCLPFETNVDYLNGVSFSKGCYIGQELIARSQFVLNVRKRLLPVTLPLQSSYPVFPPECTILNEKQEKIGRLRSCYEQYGLALLKSDECFKSQYLLLKGFDMKLKCSKPTWWPASNE